jgi:hypothetical protein
MLGLGAAGSYAALGVKKAATHHMVGGFFLPILSRSHGSYHT